MVNISKALNASSAQTYHKADYSNPQQAYYSGENTIKGEWHGKLAPTLGLSGEVGATEFARLTEGQHPFTEEQMVKHRIAQVYENPDGTTTKAVEHRAGWDAQFAPSKSVSLTALVGGDERVKDAHRAAVSIALDELERYTQARMGGNHPAETTGKLIAAKFEHDTARPVDGYAAPQLHTHAIIFNVTERADGSTRSLQPQSFFDSQNYVSAVYQSTLMFKLRELGYDIETGKSGAPEIKGYSQAYLDASSLRSQKIREELERTGHSGPEAAEIAARSTRERKSHQTREEVLAAHKEIAADFGNQPQEVIAAARVRANLQVFAQDTFTHAKEAVTFAKAAVFEREAVADERIILRDALRRGMGETTFAEVKAEFESRRATGEFRSVEGHKHTTGRNFTTPETIAAERANIHHVLEGRNTLPPILSAELAEVQARSRPFLNDSQRKAIERVLNSPDRVQGLQGLAGTGKTTTLEVVREGAEKAGYKIEGFAPSSRAAGQLREAGIDATTLQSFLARGDKPGDSARPHLYMLDESSLASSRQMRAFLDKIGTDDRVLVIGDTRQHQAVDAGRPFQQMQEAGMQTAQLDKIVRQKDPELLKAVQLLAQGQTVTGIAMLADQGRVTQIANGNDRIAAIAKDYAVNPENTIIVSPDNRSRQQINEAVRAAMRQDGSLPMEGQTFRTLAHRGDMTGADRTWAARYNPGEVLQYTSGSKAERIERGSFATVRSVDARANTLTVELETGSTVTYDPKRLRGVNAFRETDREFATGDRLQFTGQNKELQIANRDLGTVTGIEDSRITVRLDGKEARTVSFDSKEFRQFDHGYAVTSHSSQGITAGRVIANIDTESSRNLINTRLAYVAISRASNEAQIYTNDAENLGKKLSQDITKTAALDFYQKSFTEQTREAVEEFRKKKPAAATEILQEQKRVHEYGNPDHRLAAVALDYAARPDRAVIVAPSASERKELTQLIREDLKAQGRITEARPVPVLIERDLQNPRIANNYKPGDEIHYKASSPKKHGIPNNSSGTVLSVNASKNLITVSTRDGEQTSYNPALLKKQTGESLVYREETRDLGIGDRIRLTSSERQNQTRAGAFATVERIGEDKTLTVRLDSGRAVELKGDQGRHIEPGYTVESPARLSANRIVLTGEGPQLAQQEAALTKLNRHTRDLTIYTSQSIASVPNTEKAIKIPSPGIEHEPAAVTHIPIPQLPEREYTGFSLGR